jgi:hypothetical protein
MREQRARRPRTVSVSIRFLLLTWMLSLGVAPSGPAMAQTASQPADRVTVGSVAEFEQALAAAGEAKVIALKPGIYDELTIRGVSAGTAVTVVAAEPANRPVIHKLSVSSSRNVMLEGLRFVGTGKEAPESFVAEIRQSQNIRIRKSEFSAPQAQVAGNASALRAVEVTTLHLADTVIENLNRGILIDRSTAVVIEHSQFRRLNLDGLAIVQSDGVTFDSNRLDTFRPETIGARHFVMASTRQTTAPSRNIRITRNVMTQTEGEPISGVFLANEEKRPYETVDVSKNIIITGSPHGITLNYAINASITDNMVLDSVESIYNNAIRLQNSRNSEVSRNIAVAYGYTANQGIVSLRNITVPRQNSVTRRRIVERVLEGLKQQGSGPYPVHAGHSVMPEHRVAGPRL